MVENQVCKHCDKVAEWRWSDADGNETSVICQRCMETLSIYQNAPLWQFTPIRGKFVNLPKTYLRLADAEIIQRVLNLTHHPMFEAPHREELPAWHEAIADLGKLVQTVEIEGVASTVTQPGQHSKREGR